mmetsp:Transcript_35269/g.60937  ORF Transcript_35269/g.60937 Transcript_35269/m.60937 type:complete len:476 (+) Transcript_35269:90-1517(+)
MDDKSGEWSDSEFEESGFQSSTGGSEAKPTPVGKGRTADLKNQPFDEALDLSQSQSVASSAANLTPGGPGSSGGGRTAQQVSNQAHDEALDLSESHVSPTSYNMDAKADRDAKGEGPEKNKPYDEAVDIDGSSDGSDESSVDTNASPKNSAPPTAQAKGSGGPMGSSAAAQAQPRTQQTATATAQSASRPSPAAGRTDDESSEEESEDESHEASGIQVDGAYNANDFKHLQVSAEIKDLFQYIQRYKPHEVELDTTLKCFIPDFIPAVGEMDAFIKVPSPDGNRDELGLKVLDEPSAHQSDSTVLELQLRAISKKQHGDVAVRSIENAAKSPAEIEKWIKSIEDLHRQKPSVDYQYKKNMPDIESLMQEWPEEFEEMLQKTTLPGPDMELSLEEYAKVICAIMDVPVYDNLIESLHVIFSLYMEFKDNPHFAARSKANEEGGENMMMGGGGGGGGDFGGEYKGGEEYKDAQVMAL